MSQIEPQGPHTPFSSVPVEITVSVGKARPLVRELVGLSEDMVLPLDKRIEDPVELYVAGKLIARGILEEMEGDSQGQIGVRLTEIANLRDGL